VSDVKPRKMPVEIRRIEIQEGPYAGWWAEMRVNPPQRVITQLLGDLNLEVLGGLIQTWNFVDDAGADLDPKTQMGEIPPDLFRALYQKYLHEVFHPFWLDGEG
jgi:hypothetical protein